MKGWKTITFNVLMGILLLVQHQAHLWEIPEGIAETILVVGNFILRFVTSTPVGKKA